MTDLARLLRSRPHLAEYNPNLFSEVGVVSPSRHRPSARTSAWRDERAMSASFEEHIQFLIGFNPLYALLYHVPNEDSYTSPGVRAGIPDYHLPVAKPYIDKETGLLRWYHSLYFEFKTADGDLSPKQEWWILKLREQGNFAEVIWENLDDALRILDWYLEDNGEDSPA